MGSTVLLGGLHAAGRVEMNNGFELQSTVIVVVLFCVILLSPSIVSARKPTPSTQQTVNPISAAQSEQDARELVAGVTVERELAGGETHAYRVSLTTGQYLCAVVEQRGIDVVVMVFGPDGQQVAEVDSPIGEQGQERVYVVAEGDGSYRVVVVPLNKYAARGRYQVSIEELRTATAQDRSLMAAQTAYDEGHRARLQGTEESLHEAVKKYEEALRLCRAAGDRAGALAALRSIGFVYEALGEQQQALEYYDQVLLLQRAVGSRAGEVVMLSSIGFVYESLGEQQRALEYYGQALTLRRAGGDRSGEAVSLTSIGFVYESLEEQQRALENFNEALTIRKAVGDRRGEALTLTGIGIIYDKLGEKRRALEYFNEALPLRKAVGDRRGEAHTLTGIGFVYQSMGAQQKALEYFNEALTLRQAVGDRRGEAHTLTGIGVAYDKLGEKHRALEYLNQALTLSRAVRNRNAEANILLNIARAESDRANLTEARHLTETALDIIESQRIRIGSQELRTSYLASKRDYYEFYIDLLMRLHQNAPTKGHDAMALRVSERARARSLLETLSEARSDIRQGVDSELLVRERTLQQQLNAKEQYRVQLLNGKHTEERAKAVERELSALISEYQETQARIRTTSPRYAALTQPTPLSLEEIQRQLDADTLLLEFALGEERSYLWAVTPTSITSFVLPKRAEIETAARRAYDLLMTSHKRESKRQAELAASDLSRMVLGPVAEQLGKKRLLIVSEGALQYVPFAAMPEPDEDTAKGRRGDAEKGRRGETAMNTAMKDHATNLRVPASPLPRVAPVPLVVNHEIVSLPSASVLAVLRRELAGRQLAPKTLAVFADPIFQSDDPRVKRAGVKRDREQGQPSTKSQHGRLSESDLTRSARESGLMTFERLRFTRQEADTIVVQARDRDSLKALDFDAGRSTVMNAGLDEYRIVHFATHGLLNSQHPELSGIVLSLVDEEGRAQDGFLRAHDIYNLKLRADLVVLSACQTALGKEIKGEGIAGLTRGFMYAGAARVVASLWDVKDEATAELMKRFYRAMLRDGLRPAAALRAAQISMWKEPRWGAPYYWAGFVLQGEWR